MSVEFCRGQARQLLAQVGAEAPPVDVERVAQLLGLKVRQASRARGYHGKLLQQRMEIEVNRKIDRRQRRFAVAHEVGHYVLGHTPVVAVFNERSSIDPYQANEWQADSFAAELLMPEAWLRSRATPKPDYRSLAELFDVSDERMFARLEQLGLLGLQRRWP
jgi:Zn-dependent peptidase ImmA (M78 family)